MSASNVPKAEGRPGLPAAPRLLQVDAQSRDLHYRTNELEALRKENKELRRRLVERAERTRQHLEQQRRAGADAALGGPADTLKGTPKASAAGKGAVPRVSPMSNSMKARISSFN
jgi:hypothetical protein